MSALEIKGLAKSYGEVEALRKIDLSIAAGEFVCLLGESGCGKTTLLRLIAGLETANAGTLELDGEDLTQIPAHARNMGMVFQSLALFAHLNVAKNIAYGLARRKVSAAEQATKVEELLGLVGLSGLGNRRVSALSGGQRQRVAIARALAIEPSLFLMDEPFSALDAGLREHLQAEVRALQQQLDITTIFVTHDQREAMAMADRIVVMNGGQIEQAASPTDLYARPATRFVAGFIGTNNILDVEVRGGQAFLGEMKLGPVAAADGPQTLALRPEHLSLSGGSLNGTVISTRILGATTETEVDVAGHRLIQTQVTDPAAMPQVEDAVQLGFAAQNLWVIPD